MPIYEYHCDECNKDFECLVIRRDEIPECPECKGKNVKKMMSACGFTSKGTGTGGETVSKSAAGTSSCSGCSATSCAGCGQ